MGTPQTDSLLREWLLIQLGLPSDGDLKGVSPFTTVWDASNGTNKTFAVLGRYNHAVQIVAGGDTFKIQGDAGAGFVDIAGQTGIVPDGIRQFTGVYTALKVVRTAGAGATSKVTVYSIR